ncbi:MAG: type II toxin-antitoxin system YafQ family toxin [Deltaproteobacteria bacterium]|nr:type II toxin-antitoxin system YafQ family toxin [Deltaproteobacteria bacterium]
MRSIRRDTQFKKDVKRLVKRSKDLNKLKKVIRCLVRAEKLPAENKDHQLKGILKDCRECHIEPDWLLIYRIEGSELCLVRTGSHSDLSINMLPGYDSEEFGEKVFSKRYCSR